jgi:catechol 2,3-dioxygenase-like lactoylglutathione lyase family enzyme
MTGIIFHHLHLKSADPVASARFYRDAFGATPMDEAAPPGRQVLDFGGIRVFIDSLDAGAADLPPAPRRGLEHMAFDVPELEDMIERLRALNVELTAPPRTLRPGLRIAFFYGPDGEYIELIERKDD